MKDFDGVGDDGSLSMMVDVEWEDKYDGRTGTECKCQCLGADLAGFRDILRQGCYFSINVTVVPTQQIPISCTASGHNWWLHPTKLLPFECLNIYQKEHADVNCDSTLHDLEGVGGAWEPAECAWINSSARTLDLRDIVFRMVVCLACLELNGLTKGLQHLRSSMTHYMYYTPTAAEMRVICWTSCIK